MTDLKPGRELDFEVAERVMGWKRHGRVLIPPMPPGTAVCVPAVPAYSTDIAAARTVVQKMNNEGFAFGTDESPNELSACVVCIREGEVIKAVASETAQTLPHAICLAALKAVGYLQD